MKSNVGRYNVNVYNPGNQGPRVHSSDLHYYFGTVFNFVARIIDDVPEIQSIILFILLGFKIREEKI